MPSRYLDRFLSQPVYTHLRISAILVGLWVIFFAPMIVSAQSYEGWPSLLLFSAPAHTPETIASAEASPVVEAVPPLPLVIDTDPGVDDAVALAWLLSTIDAEDILGIVTVAGNTTVENATKNLNTLLAQLNINSILVVEGADKPLVQKLSSRGMLVHGQDGLWGLQMDPAAIAQLQQGNQGSAPSQAMDATEFYCTTAAQSPGATILALGPLTNLAAAIQSCPAAMIAYGRVVILGGAKHGGNTTPVAEFNFWQDPEAVEIVLASGMELEIVPLDAFTQFAFDMDDLTAMFGTNQPIIQYLLPAISIYLGTQLAAGIPAASIPDLGAAMYTINGLGTPTSALVQVITSSGPTRGQSLMGVGFAERVMMITDDDELSEIAVEAFATSTDPVLPNATYVNTRTFEILMRQPDNAGVILDIDEEGMSTLFATFLFDPTNLSAIDQPSQNPTTDDAIFLPFVHVE